MKGMPIPPDADDPALVPRRFDLLRRHDWLSPVQWRRRILFWVGAILVALAAIVFAKASNYAYFAFHRIVEYSPWWPLLVTPATFALLAWLTSGALKATRGSGIPQAIAAQQLGDEGFCRRLLSLRVAAGKMGLTLVALLGGASAGREGPTVHVGAALLYSLGRRFGFAEPAAAGRFVLAGSAAGLAAAFNTPLAGVVFAIEEMAGAFEHRMSGIILTAVIIAGVVSLGLLGNYAYFGQVDAMLPLGKAWLAVLLVGVICGLAGGLFARLILLGARGPFGRIAALRRRWPVLFAAGCGLALVVLSRFGGDALYGTGYAQAQAILQHDADAPGGSFGTLKLLANVATYWAGIPGGIFSPALAVGAGIGDNLAPWLPGVDGSAVVLLGMAAYLAGVTQSPLTATVISMEMTANQDMVIPILATCLLARGTAALVCRTPVYRAFAERLIEEFRRQDTGAMEKPT